MSKLAHDLKSAGNAALLVPAAYYALLLASIVFADPERPRSVFYYNEMAFLPLVIMIAVILFQRELGGSMMEIYSTFPVSFAAMVLRKFGVAMAASALLHFGWVYVYKQKFHMLRATVYLYNGGDPFTGDATWLMLLSQSAPEYALMAGVAIFASIASKTLYGGLAGGFAVWMAETMSDGKLLSVFAIYTLHIPGQITLAFNRLLLLSAGMICLAAAILLVNRRERWIVDKEVE